MHLSHLPELVTAGLALLVFAQSRQLAIFVALTICRRNLARWTGRCGDPQLALRLAEQVAEDSTRLFGVDDETALLARFEVAVWTAQAGARPDAIRQWRALAADIERRLPHDTDFVVTVERNLAELYRKQGRLAEAPQGMGRAPRKRGRGEGEGR